MIEVGVPADPLVAVTHPNPYPYYDDLVRHRPLYFDEPLGMWVASSSDAVTAVLTSGALRVRPMNEPIPPAFRKSVAGDLFGRFVRTTDGAQRDQLKSVVSARLDTFDVERIGQVTLGHAAMLFAGLGHPPDWHRFTSDFALPLSSYVMTTMLGIDQSTAPAICRWLDDFVRTLSPTATPRDVEAGISAAEQLASALKVAGGFVAGLTRDIQDAGFADPDIALANAFGLLLQPYEATAGLIGNAAIELSRRCDVLEGAYRDPTVLSDVVKNVVVNDSPVHNTRRFVAEQVTVLGATLARGDRVLAVLAAANRDPKSNGRVSTFGVGAHACPGATIAMTMATKALECIVRERIDFAPIASTVSYRPSQNTRIPMFG